MGTMQWQTERVSLFFRWTMDGQGVLISNSLKQIIVHTSTLVVFPVLLLHLDWELVVGSGQTCVFEFKQNIGGSILNVSITVAIQSNGQISVTHILEPTSKKTRFPLHALTTRYLVSDRQERQEGCLRLALPLVSLLQLPPRPGGPHQHKETYGIKAAATELSQYHVFSSSASLFVL